MTATLFLNGRWIQAFPLASRHPALQSCTYNDPLEMPNRLRVEPVVGTDSGRTALIVTA